MSKIAEKKVMELGYGTDPLDRKEYSANDVFEAGVECYDQAMQDFMKKAEGFLTGRVVLCFRVSWTEQQTPFLDFNIKNIVEQFKKHMQNEM